jgi:hypothetical protein
VRSVRSYRPSCASESYRPHSYEIVKIRCRFCPEITEAFRKSLPFDRQLHEKSISYDYEAVSKRVEFEPYFERNVFRKRVRRFLMSYRFCLHVELYVNKTVLCKMTTDGCAQFVMSRTQHAPHFVHWFLNQINRIVLPNIMGQLHDVLVEPG